MIIQRCPLCGSAQVFPWGSGYTPYILMECYTCGAVWEEEEGRP